MNEYYEPRFGKNVRSIDIGECCVSDADAMIGTILGSCVAVVLHDADRLIGGMNHYQMPEVGRLALDDGDEGRYGKTSLPRLLAKMARAGCSPDGLRAKVFGGSSLMLAGESNIYAIGSRNVDCALHFLDEHGIPIDVVSVGGHYGRKIFFDISNYTVYVKTLH